MLSRFLFSQDVNPFDPELNVYWPPPVGGRYLVSDKDMSAPTLQERQIMLPKEIAIERSLVIGVSGQVGSALVEQLGYSSCFGTYVKSLAEYF